MKKKAHSQHILGVDIGGTGIKAAPVDVSTGKLLTERVRIETPQPATPKAVSAVVRQLCMQFAWKGRVGCAFPAVVKSGTVLSAANVSKTWIGTNGRQLFERATKCKTVLLNDADAAGLAEMNFGAGRNKRGLVIMLTLGTGIGSAVFYDGQLIPNTEIGHLKIRGKDAEKRASERARKDNDLSWKKWSKRVREYLEELECLLTPELFILGGGGSKNFQKFAPYLKVRTKVVAAELLNDAGIIGAALAAK